jgi:hypothetical protein
MVALIVGDSQFPATVSNKTSWDSVDEGFEPWFPTSWSVSNFFLCLVRPIFEIWPCPLVAVFYVVCGQLVGLLAEESNHAPLASQKNSKHPCK